MKELKMLLSNIKGYGTYDQPITVGILTELIKETISKIEREKSLTKGQ